jgi:hypothetical protein
MLHLWPENFHSICFYLGTYIFNFSLGMLSYCGVRWVNKENVIEQQKKSNASKDAGGKELLYTDGGNVS